MHKVVPCRGRFGDKDCSIAKKSHALQRRRARCNRRLIRATAFTLSLAALWGAPRSAPADGFTFIGTTQILYPQGGLYGTALIGFSTDQTGSFGDSTVWDDDNAAYAPEFGQFAPRAPGAGDSVDIYGIPAGDLTPTVGGPNYDGGTEPAYPYEGSVGGSQPAGYTGGGFQLSGVGGTIASLEASGPGTLSLTNLDVTGSTIFQAVGAFPILQYIPGSQVGDTTFVGYAPTAQVITGGSLSTPMLLLSAGTLLTPHPNGTTTEVPDPVADAGSLTISGAQLSGTVTQIAGDLGYSLAFFNPSYPSAAYNVQPVTMTGATLTATTELDLIGNDLAAFPNATGTTTLAASGSTITAGIVVIATGASGYGSGSAGAAALLTLTGASTLTAGNTIYVGDTGDGTLNASGGSTINDEQAVLGNAPNSTGTATIDGSTWNNAGYMAVGNSGVGMLTVQNGGQIISTGPNGNGFIAGLTGSGGSVATITGSGSLWQTSGYFEVGGDDEGTLNVQDNAKVVTGDIMYVGFSANSGGTLAISGGGTVTTSTLDDQGTSATILGFMADSTGTLTIDGAGSQLESKGDMSVGYSGNATATITNGGVLMVDTATFRVGRNLGSTGVLTVTGTGSSVSADNATIYIGFGGTGTVNVDAGATLSVMATNVGGESTGEGILNIDGTGTSANLGDAMIGAGGSGTLNITGGATVNTGNIEIGVQPGDAGLLMGANAQVVTDGDMIVGDQALGTVQWTNQSMLSVNSLTVGSGAHGVGILAINTGAGFTTADDATVGDDEGSQGTVTVDATGSKLTINGDLTVGGGGTGSLTVSGNGTVSNQGGTVGDEDTSTGTVEVTGAGSIWHTNGDLTIGQSGTGDVTVEEGGTLRVDGDLTLGENEDSDGTLTFAGPTTVFTFGGGDVTIGSSGSGTMIVQSNAFVDLSGNSVTLGDMDSGEGILTVTDPGTVLNTGDLTVGGSATGSLADPNGGTLTVANGGTLSSGSATIGDMGLSTGVATVTGQNSTWTTTGLTVGEEGTGTLNIENGGAVTVNSGTLTIGDGPSGDGTLTLSGAGSALNFTGNLQVGEDGFGLFAVQGAASFTGKSVNVGDQSLGVGTVNVDGAGTKMELQTAFNIGENGAGTLNVTSSAKLINDTNATLADMPNSMGTANVNSLGSWNVGGTLTVGGQSTATLTVGGGSTVSASSISIGDQAFGTGTVTVNTTSGTLSAIAASSMSFSGQLIVANAGYGTLNVNGGGQVTTFGNSTPDFNIVPDGSGGYTIDGPPIREIEVGYEQNSNGTVDVSDSGSSIQADSLIIGEDGSARVTVEKGASLVANFDTEVGYHTTGNGTLIVSGNNGATTVNTQFQAGGLQVGEYGTGFLYVDGGAMATASSFDIGELPNSNGHVSISDAKTTMQVSGPLAVGNQGTGSLSLSGGATLTATSGIVGGLPGGVIVHTANGTPGGVGTITISGSGTAMTLSGDLSIGSINFVNASYGTGSLGIMNGATLTNQNATVDGITTEALNDGAFNVVVNGTGGDGAASFWNTEGNMTLGLNGFGKVDVVSGAVAAVGGNLTLGQNTADPSNPSTGNSDGTLVITGHGTTFNENGAGTTIGGSGAGFVLVNGAANANFSSSVVTLGQNPSGSGSMDVGSSSPDGGLGSLVQLNAMVVGDGGTGNIDIDNGGTMISNSNYMTIGNQQNSTGTVTVEGPLSELTLNSGATVTVGLSGTGTFNVTNTASFDVDKFVLGENSGATGTANVTGTGAAASATLLFDDTLIVGDNGTGNLNITAGGLVAPSGTGAGNVILGAKYRFPINPSSKGTVTVDGSTSHFEANSLVVGGPATSPGTGYFELKNGATAHVATSVTMGIYGTINVEGDSFDINGINLPTGNGGGLTIGSTGTLAAVNQILVNSGGTLGGGGSIVGDVVNAGGTVSPGDPQTLTISGDYDQTGGVLDLQFAGTGPGEFDQIAAGGDIAITGGTVDLDFIDGFAPQQGDTFDFLSAAGVLNTSGVTFDTTGLEAGFDFSTQIDPATGAYELVALNNAIAVPEPGGAGLAGFGLGVFALLAMRRPRRLRAAVVVG